MLPFFLGMFSATIFGVVSYWVYGSEEIIVHGWIHMVFWALIGAGTLVTLVNRHRSCLFCRIARLAHVDRLRDRLCKGLACA